MKKILITIAAISVCLMIGCGNKVEKTESGTVSIETDESANTTAVETQAPEPAEEEPATEAIPEPEPEPEPKPLTWFEEHGLSITPQGDFTYQTMLNDGHKDLSEIDIPSNVSIIETTEGVDEGYKKVVASFHDDISSIDFYKETYLAWHTAFDRYSGIAFEVSSDAVIDKGLHKGSIPIEYDGKVYDVSIEYEFNSNDMSADEVITVICPEDYDGTVFQVGYTSMELLSENEKIDLMKLHTLDEFPQAPENGHTYYYFSYSNE